MRANDDVLRGEAGGVTGARRGACARHAPGFPTEQVLAHGHQKSQVRKKESEPLRGGTRRRRLSPPLGIAAHVPGGSNLLRRVQRRGWFAGKDSF